VRGIEPPASALRTQRTSPSGSPPARSARVTAHTVSATRTC